MRHNKKFNHLGRTASHRSAMLSNMACSLIKHKRITTTVAKAKALKKFVEPLITKSKEDTTNSRRVVFSNLQDKIAVTELFKEISVKIADRPGGYTRIIKTGNRLGDNAEMCFIELVDYNENMAKETLKKWRSRITSGEFEVVRRVQGGDADRIERERYVNIDQLIDGLKAVNKKKYPYALEANFSVIDNLFTASQLKQGVKCGASGIIEGTYKTNNESMKLENALKGAWGTNVGDRYWEENPTLTISKIKQCVEDIIAEGFSTDGQISISAIYDRLKDAPYGILPCNLTAFVLGFVLREYANDTYRYNDGLTSDYMSVAKLQEMVDDIIKQQNTPNPRYKDKYIGTMTDEEKSFNEVTSVAFDISMTFCTSIQHTRDMIRNKMKELSFPIWCAKNAIDACLMKTDIAVIKEAIDLYTGLANSNNSLTNSSDTDSALRIGKLGRENPNLKDDLKNLFTKQVCKEGMDRYLHEYQDGVLIALANEVGDNGQYINELKRKFDADAANWVWNIDTEKQKVSLSMKDVNNK